MVIPLLPLPAPIASNSSSSSTLDPILYHFQVLDNWLLLVTRCEVRPQLLHNFCTVIKMDSDNRLLGSDKGALGIAYGLNWLTPLPPEWLNGYSVFRTKPREDQYQGSRIVALQRVITALWID